jgi:hypothetical protein
MDASLQEMMEWIADYHKKQLKQRRILKGAYGIADGAKLIQGTAFCSLSCWGFDSYSCIQLARQLVLQVLRLKIHHHSQFYPMKLLSGVVK